MFRRSPVQKSPIPFSQRLITLGIIFFFLYFYFTDFQVKQLEKHQLSKRIAAKNIKITNLVMDEVISVNPKQSSKTTITLNKKILEKAMKESKGDNIDIITVEVPIEAAPQPASLTK